MQIEIKFPAITELCAYCFGSGRLKAMQSVALFGGGSIQGRDTTMKCPYCKGKGVRNQSTARTN